jgi:hypothetical protein
MLDKEPGKSAARPKAGAAKTTTTKTTTTKTAAAKPLTPKAASNTTARRARSGAAPAGDLQAQIRQRAYELWERDGRPEGRDDVHWAEAEREIRGSQRAA